MSRPNVTMLYSAVVQYSDDRGRHSRSKMTKRANWAVSYGGGKVEESCYEQNVSIANEPKSIHLKL